MDASALGGKISAKDFYILLPSSFQSPLLAGCFMSHQSHTRCRGNSIERIHLEINTPVARYLQGEFSFGLPFLSSPFQASSFGQKKSEGISLCIFTYKLLERKD